ncbi:unnamed protein product [Polarella glacialis]|uniref:Uncharacterized protein n=1 Tax=Polarella glacialis TaxID=89957 RepID=A0A813HXU5_POLGL|nr:unnamed protein product [Polarella glacialis]
MAEAVGSFEERSALRRRLESYVAVQDLAPNTWLLRSSADEAGEDVIVAAELLKPALSSKEPAVLRNLLDKALCEANSTAQWFCNDRYFKQTVPGAADVCLEIVCPATAKDIAKRRAVPLERCLETQALYDSVTVPGTLVGAAARDKWVANIMRGSPSRSMWWRSCLVKGW